MTRGAAGRRLPRPEGAGPVQGIRLDVVDNLDFVVVEPIAVDEKATS